MGPSPNAVSSIFPEVSVSNPLRRRQLGSKCMGIGLSGTSLNRAPPLFVSASGSPDSSLPIKWGDNGHLAGFHQVRDGPKWPGTQSVTMVQAGFGSFTPVQFSWCWFRAGSVSASWGRRKGGSDGIKVHLCNREHSARETKCRMVQLRGGGPEGLLEVVGLQEETEGSTVGWLPWWAATLDCQDPLFNKGLDLSKPHFPYL